MTDRQDKGVTPTGSGCSPTASAVPASCKQSIPDAGHIQKRIAEARRARGMSLEEVADAAGLSKSHVWEMEQGRSTNPTVKAVWALSKALAVTPARFAR